MSSSVEIPGLAEPAALVSQRSDALVDLLFLLRGFTSKTPSLATNSTSVPGFSPKRSRRLMGMVI